MSMLNPVSLNARVVGLLVNTDSSDLTSEPVTQVEAKFEGFPGETHSGLTRASCVRVQRQYEKGTEIRNTRQLSALSVEELADIAKAMGINPIEPAWVGANLIFEGIPQFSKIPPSSRLIFDSGASLVVDLENSPCKYPGDIIERHHPGKGHQFPKLAKGRRGVTLWVERPGLIVLNDRVTLHVPPRVEWAHY